VSLCLCCKGTEKIQERFCYERVLTFQSEFSFVRDNLRIFDRYIGQTDSGIYILLSRECTGGMGIFPRLLMVTFEKDKGMIIDWDRKIIHKDKDQLLIKKVGEIALGDHWIGELNVEGNKLFIGSDVG
jgi:hypothetical protein